MISESQIYQEAADAYLDGLPKDCTVAPKTIGNDILGILVRDIEIENHAREKPKRIKIPTDLPPEVVAHILLRRHPIVNLSYMPPGEQGDTILAMYQEDGENAGLYVVDDKEIGKLARKYNYRFRSKEIKDVLYLLSLEAPVRYLTPDRDLIAVNNGIFDYRNKVLMPFNPNYVFTSKSRVLNMNYYSFTEPKACLDMLGEFKVTNDPVRQFLEEVLPKAQWNVLPYDFLWDVYNIWFRQDTPAGRLDDSTTFCRIPCNLCGARTTVDSIAAFSTAYSTDE